MFPKFKAVLGVTFHQPGKKFGRFAEWRHSFRRGNKKIRHFADRQRQTTSMLTSSVQWQPVRLTRHFKLWTNWTLSNALQVRCIKTVSREFTIKAFTDVRKDFAADVTTKRSLLYIVLLPLIIIVLRKIIRCCYGDWVIFAFSFSFSHRFVIFSHVWRY